MAENSTPKTDEEIDGIVPDNDESNLELSDESGKEDLESDNEEDDNSEQIEITEDNEDDGKEFPVQKKRTKLHLILYIVAGVLVTLIIAGIVLYFIYGTEEEPPQKVIEVNTTTSQEVKIEKPKYKFNIDDIKVKRLNAKLELLTKYEILENEEIEKQKQAELAAKENEFKKRDIKFNRDSTSVANIVDENNLSKFEKPLDMNTSGTTLSKNDIEKKSEYNDTNIEFEQKDKNDSKVSEQNNNKQITQNNKTTVDTKKESLNESKTFLKFVQIATLKYKLYKGFLERIKEVDARISICKDEDQKTLILIGPFKESENRKFIIDEINKNIVQDAFAIELTNEEFEKRCSF